jgi:hypothetical protein
MDFAMGPPKLKVSAHPQRFVRCLPEALNYAEDVVALAVGQQAVVCGWSEAVAFSGPVRVSVYVVPCLLSLVGDS